MELRTLIAVAAAGMGALALGAMGAILWLGGGPVGAAGGAAQAPSLPAPAPGAGRSGPAEPPPVAPSPPAARSPGVPARPDPAEDPAWQRLPVTTAFRALGPIGRDLRAGTRRSRLEVARCLRDHPGTAGAPGRPAVLELLLEGRAGELEVVGVRIGEVGSSPPEQVECARSLLQGYRIPASTALAGQRFKVRLPLEP